MKRYIVVETQAGSGSYIRGDNYLLHLTLRDNLAKGLSTPSSIKIEIDDPCGLNVLAATDMTAGTTGIYYHDYAIPSTATYGKYEVTVSTTTYTQKEVYSYYLFPWDVEDEVRGLSGIGQGKSISDTNLNEIIWEAYQETNGRIYDLHCDERPKSCWSSCDGYNYCINGSNTTYFIAERIADYNGDGFTKGYGEQSCGTDVDGYYKDCNGWRHQVLITVQNADSGRLTVTQLDGTAIPSTAKGLYFTYHTKSCSYSDNLLRIAVMYLAAHKCILRFGELERASSADLTNAQNIKYVDPMRMWKAYRKVLRQIRIPNIDGVF